MWFSGRRTSPGCLMEPGWPTDHRDGCFVASLLLPRGCSAPDRPKSMKRYRPYASESPPKNLRKHPQIQYDRSRNFRKRQGRTLKNTRRFGAATYMFGVSGAGVGRGQGAASVGGAAVGGGAYGRVHIQWERRGPYSAVRIGSAGGVTLGTVERGRTEAG